MSGLNITEYIIGGFMSFVAVVSVTCSLTTLILINRMGKWSGYLLLVSSLTVCQLIYDCSFFFFGGYHYKRIYAVIQFLVTLGGISVALWSNILSIVVLHIVIFCSSIDIAKYYFYLFCIAMFPSLGWSIFCIFSEEVNRNDTIYTYIRFVSILLNFLVYWAISLVLYCKQNVPTLGPLKVLSSRFKYYPIIQVLIRTPAVVYQYSYGFGTSGFSSPVNTRQFVELVFYALFGPIGGIAYFIVFLRMQPQAYNELRLLFREKCSCYFCVCNFFASIFDIKANNNYFGDDEDCEIIVSHISTLSDSDGSNIKQTLRYNLLTPDSDSTLDGRSPHSEKLSDICYSPLSDSSFTRYQLMDDEELSRNLYAGQGT